MPRRQQIFVKVALWIKNMKVRHLGSALCATKWCQSCQMQVGWAGRREVGCNASRLGGSYLCLPIAFEFTVLAAAFDKPRCYCGEWNQRLLHRLLGYSFPRGLFFKAPPTQAQTATAAARISVNLLLLLWFPFCLDLSLSPALLCVGWRLLCSPHDPCFNAPK